jgi:hypothetical protein
MKSAIQQRQSFCSQHVDGMSPHIVNFEWTRGGLKG